MTDEQLRTLRQHSRERAYVEWVNAMADGKLLDVELVTGHTPIPTVRRYGARDLGKGMIRVGVIITTPDGVTAQFTGADITRDQVAHWFSTVGVPAVRVSAIKPM